MKSIASVRPAAGLYRHASEELRRAIAVAAMDCRAALRRLHACHRVCPRRIGTRSSSRPPHRLLLYSAAEPSRPVASPPFSPNWRLCPSQPLRGRRNAPRPLINTAAASHFPPLPQSDPKNKNRAAPAISAPEPNPREPLLHSPICLATSSYTLPRFHFASLPSLCGTTPSPRRSLRSCRKPSTWTAWHSPLRRRLVAL